MRDRTWADFKDHLQITAAADATKALWAKCESCMHCWPAAYYPIDLMSMSRVLKGCKCPKGCRGKPVLAKQDDGELQEPKDAKGVSPSAHQDKV